MAPYPKAIEAFPTLRQSLLASFDVCGLTTKFDLDYCDFWSTAPQARGTIFHRVAARCIEEMVAQREDHIEVDVALAILRDCLRQDDVDRLCPECGQPVVQRYRVSHEQATEDLLAGKLRARKEGAIRTVCEDGHDHSSGFTNLSMDSVKDLYWVVKKWASEWRFDPATVVAVEDRYRTVALYPDPVGGFVDRLITGQLDCLCVEGEADDHAIVLDWKDTWALPGPTSLSHEGYFQQRFYAVLVFDRYPSIQRVTTRECYPRYGPGSRDEPGYPLNVREATLWRQDLEQIRDEIGALVERFDRTFEDDTWTPTPGRHCSFCVRPQACPIPEFARGAGRIRSEAEAERVAAQLLVAEIVAKQTKEALSAWADVVGPIPVKDAKGERLYGHREIKRTSRPTQEQVAAEVEQARREGREVRINRLFRTTKGTRFEQYTPTPEERPEAQDAKLLEQLQESVRLAQTKE